MDDIGHNTNHAAGAELRGFVERIETMQAEIDERNADKRDIYAEAKARGYDVKALKHIVALRSKDPNAVQEFEAIVELYKANLGMA